MAVLWRLRHIAEPPCFWGDLMDYMTIIEASEKWNISRRRIQTLCSTGRIPGTERFGSAWMIPKNAVKPADARIKSGKYIGVSAKYQKAKKAERIVDDVKQKNNGHTHDYITR